MIARKPWRSTALDTTSATAVMQRNDGGTAVLVPDCPLNVVQKMPQRLSFYHIPKRPFFSPLSSFFSFSCFRRSSAASFSTRRLTAADIGAFVAALFTFFCSLILRLLSISTPGDFCAAPETHGSGAPPKMEMLCSFLNPPWKMETQGHVRMSYTCCVLSTGENNRFVVRR